MYVCINKSLLVYTRVQQLPCIAVHIAVYFLGLDAAMVLHASPLFVTEGRDNYDSLTETLLHGYLDKKAAESKFSFTAATLDSLVGKELHMDMFVKSARSSMELMFMAYISLLRRSGLKWVIAISLRCPYTMFCLLLSLSNYTIALKMFSFFHTPTFVGTFVNLCLMHYPHHKLLKNWTGPTTKSN